MARNEEKAQSILNRWLSQQRPDTQNQRRPAVTSECKSLGEAERWRMQLLKEIGNKVMYIQNGKISIKIIINFYIYIKSLINTHVAHVSIYTY
jgi:pre-mRNA-splicing factor ISY1